MNFSKIICIIALFCFAESAKARPYFDCDSISPILIDPAIKIKGEAWSREVDAIIKLQSDFDLEKIDQAIAEKKLKPETLVQFVEPEFTQDSHPKLYHLLERTRDTSIGVTENIKKYWNQTRPYLSDSRIKMLITPSDGPCYPSGHATGSYIYADILKLLMPEKSVELQSYANQISHNRIVIGMHYEQDTTGGKQLSQLIVEKLMQNEDFQDDLKEAKKELNAMKNE